MANPNFSERDAVKIVREKFDLVATVSQLPSELDQNFLVKDKTGRKFVLKIGNAEEQKETLDFQNKVMEFLAKNNPPIVCPQIVPSISGEKITTVSGADGFPHYVRLLAYIPGQRLVDIKRHSPELLSSIGRYLGNLDKALTEFSHPAMNRKLIWDIKHAIETVSSQLGDIENSKQRKLVEGFLQEFEQKVVPILPDLRTSVIYNDANDYNVLVDGRLNQKMVGTIDFGDIVHTYTVAEIAIAGAYTMLDKKNPIFTAAQTVKGYHEAFPLTEPELKILFSLICMRLCTSVAISASRKKVAADNQYLTVSEKPAWHLLEYLATVSPQFAHTTFRNACKLSPCPKSAKVVKWLKGHESKIGPVCNYDLKTESILVFDLSVGSLEIPNPKQIENVNDFTKLLFSKTSLLIPPLLREEKKGGVKSAKVGIGRYNEARLLYTGEQFKSEESDSNEQRTIHLGIDLFMEAGEPILAPSDGIIHSFANNKKSLDYGPTIILQHQIPETKETFFTLYGHLSLDSLDGLYEGMSIKKGEQIGKLGASEINGGWPPHLHFQIISDMLDKKGDFPGVAAPGQREIWLSICPDPNLILGIPEDNFPQADVSKDEILQTRKLNFSKTLSISYQKPLKIVRGWMQYLYDDEGRRYLDAVNNVPHVGHSHPRVVKAAQEQMAVLNTNTRYLHDNLVRYAQRLCEKLPGPLSVCFFVNSGSEANDLALRLAKAHTKATEIIVVDGAYHGNLTSLVDISPYKFDGRGGSGAPAHVHKVIMPDVYRGPFKADDSRAGEKYAQYVLEEIEKIQKENKNVAAFICESLLGCGGQIVLPENYLKDAYRHVRDAGGVCIADEVQVGFGRVGSHFWGFETQEVVPDIVTLGKPIGNGHPLAAVVTTPEIAASFETGMEYFNTFGGNPVSCAVGLAVLDVIEEEKLQDNALKVGTYLKKSLEKLKEKHALIGDVRGLGLFLGIELVRDRDNLEPAAEEASYLIERMKDCGILLSTDGPLHNVIKIKPPICFNEEDADLLVRTLDGVLDEI
ncbi:aminotransferase class III-fold pyridoxal phosphate-dependent enzyme [candidate division KSB1 bacterium]|nr:aminotransferase class III-fold pyridoxal phosphate-dependent enzyme [candidate division KSB1 bacterium]